MRLLGSGNRRVLLGRRRHRSIVICFCRFLGEARGEFGIPLVYVYIYFGVAHL